MKTLYGTINAFHIKGKTLKRLIFSPSGVVVYEGKKVSFLSLPEMRKTVYEPDYEAEQKVVFASNQLGKIQELDDDEAYLIVFTRGMMQIHRRRIEQDFIIILGETL
ncbi:MAG: hypothetical protein L7H07_02875 [Candidatus Nanopusillus sp.]|nr:hypothetical protein [Candidatus Nanopusillus sp.]